MLELIFIWIQKHASIIIALSALCLTIWQGRLTRRHNMLSVKPIIDSWFFYSENELHFWIKNKGLGTAIITDFEMALNNNKLTHENLKAELEKLPLNITYKAVIGELNAHGNTSLAKDEKVDLIKIQFENISSGEDISEYLEKVFILNIKYTCMYGKTFTFSIGR